MDPRHIVTDTAFRVAPELLGAELATPKRRALALLVDITLAGILANLGGGVIAGLVAAVLFFRLAMRSGKRHPLRRMGRAALALVGALILFGTAVSFIEGDDDEADATMTGLSGADSAEVAKALTEADEQLAALGLNLDAMTPASVRNVLNEVREATREEPRTADERAEAEAALRRYTEAFAAQDSTTLDSLQRVVQLVVAGDELRRRAAVIEGLEDRVDDLEDENEELTEIVENPSFRHSVRALAADFGLTFGWIGVYFTLILAWWNGYTPGKRLLGVRVYRLDGRSLTLWMAFERFGGYAAGAVTGLLGFAQVYWDPNRQGVHDKIASTVVIRMQDEKTVRQGRTMPALTRPETGPLPEG